jgi:hypothetical protein
VTADKLFILWMDRPSLTVMAGLAPAIHENKRVDHRDKPGDDGHLGTEIE